MTLFAYLASGHYGIGGMLLIYVAINALLILPWSTWIFVTKRVTWANAALARAV